MRKFTSLLLLGFALGSFAQTPGGVSGSELWFKTAPLNSDLQGYYRWQDFSGDSIRLMLLDSRGVKSELTLPMKKLSFFHTPMLCLFSYNLGKFLFTTSDDNALALEIVESVFGRDISYLLVCNGNTALLDISAAVSS